MRRRVGEARCQSETGGRTLVGNSLGGLSRVRNLVTSRDPGVRHECTLTIPSSSSSLSFSLVFLPSLFLSIYLSFSLAVCLSLPALYGPSQSSPSVSACSSFRRGRVPDASGREENGSAACSPLPRFPRQLRDTLSFSFLRRRLGTVRVATGNFALIERPCPPLVCRTLNKMESRTAFWVVVDAAEALDP